MGKILPVEAVVGAAMLKNKGWLRGRICFENEVVYTERAQHTHQLKLLPLFSISYRPTHKLYGRTLQC